MKPLNARIVCSDEFSMSVQASEYSYCKPRDDIGPWIEVECGYPSEEEPLLMKWAEDPNRPTDTVYGWVPVGVVLRVVKNHGGMVSGELPEMPPLMELMKVTLNAGERDESR